MEKKDLSKQQRRKRKDPESRDFFCDCGKSYLSYAAAYTHVKNKHGGSKNFIKKPQKEKLKRGRPKDRKQVTVSLETQSLSICEETTLLIFESLRDKKDIISHHIILEGNEEQNQQRFKAELQRLRSQNDGSSETELQVDLNDQKYRNIYQKFISEQDFKLTLQFVSGVNKHFVGEMAAKVVFSMGVLLQNQLFQTQSRGRSNNTRNSDIQILSFKLNRPGIEDKDQLWYGEQRQILEILAEQANRWFSTLKNNNGAPSGEPNLMRNSNSGSSDSSEHSSSERSDSQMQDVDINI